MKIQLLVLDVQGIILNACGSSFLHEIVQHTGEPHAPIDRCGYDDVRHDAWSGRIDDRVLWERLALGLAGDRDWRGLLASGYTLGPAADHIAGWAKHVPIGLLPNHRTHWLLPRPDRFELTPCFGRIRVSDGIGFAKPDM